MKGCVLKYLVDFLECKNVQKCHIYEQLKCSLEEAKLLQLMTKEYVQGSVDLDISEILIKLFGNKNYAHLHQLVLVKELIEQGWIVQNNFLNYSESIKNEFIITK